MALVNHFEHKLLSAVLLASFALVACDDDDDDYNTAASGVGYPTAPIAGTAGGFAGTGTGAAGTAAAGRGAAGTAAAGTGAGGTGAGGTGSSMEPAQFSDIYAMLFPVETASRCNLCHGQPASDAINGNLSMGMDADAAHAALVGQASTSSQCMGMPLVVPGEPDDSLLLKKLRPNPPCGMRMPFGLTPISEAQLSMVESWIAAGANND